MDASRAEEWAVLLLFYFGPDCGAQSPACICVLVGLCSIQFRLRTYREGVTARCQYQPTVAVFLFAPRHVPHPPLTSPCSITLGCYPAIEIVTGLMADTTQGVIATTMSGGIPVQTSSPSVAAIATTMTTILALTTPFDQKPECTSIWDLTSTPTWTDGSSTTLTILASDTADTRFVSCQPSGWNPAGHFTFSPAVCPSGWTYWNMQEYLCWNEKASKSVICSTAYCCNRYLPFPQHYPRPPALFGTTSYIFSRR